MSLTPPFFDRARIGHNRGPALDGPSRLAVHAWTRAATQRRRPSGIALRMRLSRAAELGLSGADYLAIHDFCGRDIAALAFTPAALRLHLGRRLSMPGPVRNRLAALRHVKLLCFAPPGEPAEPFRQELSEAAGVAFSASAPFPERCLPWPEARAATRALLDPDRLTGAAVLLIGAGDIEEQLYSAGRLGALLPPELYFA